MLKEWHQPLQYAEYCKECGAVRDRARKTLVCDQCGGEWMRLEVAKIDDEVHYFCSDKICRDCGKREIKEEDIKCYSCMVENSIQSEITTEESEILRKMYPNCTIAPLGLIISDITEKRKNKD